METTDKRPIKQPGLDHPITIEPSAGRVRVEVGDALVADSMQALILREQGYEPVYYFPPEDVDLSMLDPTEHTTYCPYKGHASYYSIPAGGERSINAAWQYRDAFPSVGEISGYLAFYANRVDNIETELRTLRRSTEESRSAVAAVV